MTTIFNALDQIDAESKFIRQYVGAILVDSLKMSTSRDRSNNILAEHATCDRAAEKWDAKCLAFQLSEMASCGRFNHCRNFMLPVLLYHDRVGIVEIVREQVRTLMQLAVRTERTLGMPKERCSALIESAVCERTVASTAPDTEDMSYAA